MPTRAPAEFRDARDVFHADTCRPLAAAAARGDVRLHALARGTYPGRRLPPRAMPEVASLGFWDADRGQDWGLGWHRNEGIELTYLARGSLRFAADQRSYLLHRGQLTITRPWQVHRVGEPHVTPSRLHWLILDVGVRRPHQAWRWPDWLVCSPADQKRLTTLLRHNEQPVWPATREIARCFERLADVAAAATDRRADLTRLRLGVNELLVAVLEMLDGRDIELDESLASAQRTVGLFLADLPRHLDRRWTLGEMASACGLGRSRFAHYCRLVTNLTPVQYLAKCRVEAAARMLLERPDLSVTEVGLACGFQSGQYFATVFGRLAGTPPAGYRRGRLQTPATPDR